MALDWILSIRQRVDFGVPPQTGEQYSKEGRIWDLYVGEKMRITGEIQRCHWDTGVLFSFR